MARKEIASIRKAKTKPAKVTSAVTAVLFGPYAVGTPGFRSALYGAPMADTCQVSLDGRREFEVSECGENLIRELDRQRQNIHL